ncbi:GPI transamidase component PIG-S-like [Phalaenopsis equestris]|uniref:GPI transamidase component PIG-S-like n=1 Tax=Phalaenopsis equestris TaxID=78828 RepID=UPI0009E1F7DF|nr:GPI transamidase component PIG-S-like [Phalaenopsis equestris]
MAEISESEPLNPNPDSLDGGSSSRRFIMPGIKRLMVTLSVLFSFLAGLPFLLKSTEIYRSPLPFSSIDSLSNSLLPEPPSPPCWIQAVFLRPSVGDSVDRLAGLISEEVGKRIENVPTCGSCGRNYAVSVTVDSGKGGCKRSGSRKGDPCFWRCGEVDSLGLRNKDEAVDEMLDEALGKGGRCMGLGGGKIYTVFVGVSDLQEGVRIVVGKYRHAWIVGNVEENDASLLITNIFLKYFVNGGREELVEQRKGEFVPVGLDGSVVLSFSLLNANPNDWVYGWEFQKIDEVMLAPIVEALAPVANIHIESQVLYHTPKSSISSWRDKSGDNIFGIGDLPFFVNSNEWHLDTSIAAAGRSKILQIVLYVPSRNECPLILQLPDGQTSKTNGFISPMWGGVIVWNPPECSAKSQNNTLIRRTMSPEDLQKIFQVIVGQLRLLFGFKSDYIRDDDMDMINILPSEKGFTEWELDALYRHHACYNLISCATTLESLSKLVQSLPRMIIMDEIRKQVKYSLEAASLALNNASLGMYDASAASSLQARSLAEDAFFHPSIMSISYSSLEHYFAIYMPFFAPVSLHLILAVVREVGRYRRERAKYQAFMAENAKIS